MTTKTAEVVIIGSGETAELAYEYFTHDSPYEVVAFSVEKAYLKQDQMFEKPVVAFESLEDVYDPGRYKAFVAVSYTKLNRVRTRLFHQVKDKGYTAISYVSSHAFMWRNVHIGENCFILENNVLQYGVRIGSKVTLWSGNHVGHRTTIHDLPNGNGADRFDVITLWDVLEHLPDPWKDLSAIHSRLKPNGILAMSTLNIDNWFPKIMGERWPWLMDMHLYYFDRRILEQMLTKAGFQLIHSRSYCHIVTTDYLCSKLGALGLYGSQSLRRFVAITPMKRWFIPFRFGDVQLLVAKTVS